MQLSACSVGNTLCDFEENNAEAGLPLAGNKKAAVIHLPGAGNGIRKRRLRGDRNQCPGCHQYFNSTTAFDQHRIGQFNTSRRCLTVAEMKAQNFGKNKDGFWLCPVSTKDRERLIRIRDKQR